MWINGERIQNEGRELISVINPATEEVLGEVIRGDAEDANAAVLAAQAAYTSWRKVPGLKRAHYLHEAANHIRAHHDELVRMLTQEEGKPLPESEEEVWWCEETLDYYAELARHDRGTVIPPSEPGQFNFVIKEPWGVAACIVPWNFPLLLMAWKVAPALAAGNTVVIKPSEYTPLSTLRMVEVGFAHFPAGVVNLITGFGTEAGQPLVEHPDTRMIAFTGSLATGQKIAATAGPMMKKLHLELGGKDPMVIAPDIELDVAVRGLAYSALLNTGQVCTSSERVYVHESIFNQFSEELADFVGSLKIGNGLEADTDIGPMLRDHFRGKVEDQLASALKAGATALVGGQRPTGFDRGFWLEPSVLINVDHAMAIMRDETFGPVIPLMPYKTFDDAIRMANDTPYGLGACLMTHDAKLVKRFFEDVEAGSIWINDPLTDNFAGPFGGMKMSGMGRELGIEGLDQFAQVKHVHWDVEGGLKDYWYPYAEE